MHTTCYSCNGHYIRSEYVLFRLRHVLYRLPTHPPRTDRCRFDCCTFVVIPSRPPPPCYHASPPSTFHLPRPSVLTPVSVPTHPMMTKKMVVATATYRAGIVGGVVAFMLWTTPSFIILTLAGIGVRELLDQDDPDWLAGVAPAAISLVFVAAYKVRRAAENWPPDEGVRGAGAGEQKCQIWQTSDRWRALPPLTFTLVAVGRAVSCVSLGAIGCVLRQRGFRFLRFCVVVVDFSHQDPIAARSCRRLYNK